MNFDVAISNRLLVRFAGGGHTGSRVINAVGLSLRDYGSKFGYGVSPTATYIQSYVVLFNSDVAQATIGHAPVAAGHFPNKESAQPAMGLATLIDQVDDHHN